MGDFVFFFLLTYIFCGIYMEEVGRQYSVDLEAKLNWNSVIYCVTLGKLLSLFKPNFSTVNYT